jgi:hypothetical protein
VASYCFREFRSRKDQGVTSDEAVQCYTGGWRRAGSRGAHARAPASGAGALAAAPRRENSLAAQRWPAQSRQQRKGGGHHAPCRPAAAPLLHACWPPHARLSRPRPTPAGAELAIRSSIDKDNAAALDAQLAAELPGTGLTVARLRFLMHFTRAELMGSLGALNRLVNNRDGAIRRARHRAPAAAARAAAAPGCARPSAHAGPAPPPPPLAVSRLQPAPPGPERPPACPPTPAGTTSSSSASTWPWSRWSRTARWATPSTAPAA